MDRGAWWATVHGVSQSRTGLSEHARNKVYYGQLLLLMTIDSQSPNGKGSYKLLPLLTFPPERITSILDFMNVELVPCLQPQHNGNECSTGLT